MRSHERFGTGFVEDRGAMVRPTRSGEGGFTLLEVTVVMAVITVGLLGALAVMAFVIRQNRSAVETEMAVAQMRSTLEHLNSWGALGMDQCFTEGTRNGGMVTATALPAAPDGNPQIRVTFLGEPDALAYWGMTQDFDMDGDLVSPAPASATEAETWLALPVRVRVVWADGNSGEERQVEVTSIVLNPNQ